jgi:hypothetical protein
MGQLAQSTFKTPQQVMQERLKQQQSMYASAQSPYERMGMAIGNILGGALGVQDPEMERASLTQTIYNDTLSNVSDITSPDFYTTLSKNLASAGLLPEAAYSAQEARKYRLEELDLNIKQARAGREGREAAQKNVDYYKKNPEQAEFRIAQLAETLSADPTNATALQEYNQITRAASEGSIEATQKAQKEELGTDIDKARLAKYRKDLEDAQKFGPAERWQAEKSAALTLLRNYNIDPTKPLNKQEPPLPASLLYGPVGGEITKAYERAVRPDVGTPMAAPASAPQSNDPLGIRR